MKRPQTHETDEKGNALFRDAFASWGVNPSEKNYGWDYVVEVFREGVSTGLLFNAQLKSSTATLYSADGRLVSQRLEMDAAEYLARQLQQPTFLFHADVENGWLFWSAVQLDNTVLAALDEGKTDSVTVRIPTSNLLPGRFDRFLEDLSRAHCVVVSRALVSTDDTDFVGAIRGDSPEKIDVVAEDLHEKAFRLEMQVAHDIFRGGDLPEAIRRLEAIRSSPTASIQIRFDATLQSGQLKWIHLIRSDEPQIRAAEQQLLTAQELCAIARKGPVHLRLAALIMRSSAELGLITHKYLGLAMIWRYQQERHDDPLWLTVLSFRLHEDLRAAGRKYRQALRIARATAKSRYRWIAPRPLIETAKQVTVLASILGHTEFTVAAREYRDAAFQLFKFAAAIATENENMDELFDAVTLGLLLDSSGSGAALAWSRSIVDGWSRESDYRIRAEEFMNRQNQRRQGLQFENDIKTSGRQVHENVLSAFGVDPASQPWAGLIDLALRDADPSRVLKGCQHTFACGGPWADRRLVQLGLEYAGRKTLHCTLHKYAVSGPDFDSIKERFEREFCSSCQDKAARPSEWRYSDEWQQAENVRLTQYLREFDLGSLAP
jgi:hypothetical protein